MTDESQECELCGEPVVANGHVVRHPERLAWWAVNRQPRFHSRWLCIDGRTHYVTARRPEGH